MKIGFSKFCTLHPKWCVIAGLSGTSSVCVCTTHQNTILLVDALNWEVTYKDVVNKQCVIHQIVNVWCIVVLTVQEKNTLHKFLEEELSEIDPDFQFHYSQSQTTYRAFLVTVASTCE